MRAKSAVLLVLALGCGLVAAIGITQVMANRNTGPALPSGEAETIFVATEDIAMGEPLASQVLRLEQWPKGKVPAGALTKIEDVEGRRTRTKLYAGEPILENKLFGKGASGQSKTILIPKGYRVIPVKVDTEKGGAGLILPGDRVDVAVYVPRKGTYENGIHTVLQDIKVFAVNDVVDLESQDSEGKSIAAKTISLLVTPPQSHKLMLALEMGKVRLVMRSPEDDEKIDEVSVSARELFGGTDGANREEETLMQPSPGQSQEKNGGFLQFLQQAKQKADGVPEKADPRPKHEMRIMQGPRVDVVVLEAEGNPPETSGGFGFWRPSTPSSGFHPNAAAPGLDSSPAEQKQEPPAQGQEPSEEEEPNKPDEDS